MSVVPYNRIILSLPTSNSLVLYNTLDNSLEVLSNIKHRQSTPPSSSQRQRTDNNASSKETDGYDKHSIECPNCGFIFDLDDDNAKDKKTRSPLHMDNDYFKLLQLHFATQVSESPIVLSGGGQKFIENDENQYIRLSESLFTQGYFNKFFKILKKLGTGSNGTVYKVEHLLNGVSIGTFALKKIGIGEDLHNLTMVLKEVRFLYNLTNGELYDDNISEQYEERDLLMSVDGVRHLIKYNHVWLEIDHASTFGPKIPCVFILFEYCDGGDLENYINDTFNNVDLHVLKLDYLKRKKLKLSSSRRPHYLNNFEIFKIFKDICLGVHQLHKSHIIHRDLKPSNCLLKQKPRSEYVIRSVHDLDKFPDVVVSDFGESAIEGTKRVSSGYTGTLEFTAPELLFNNINDGTLPNFDKKSDVFSMGLILYFLCFNKLPYNSSNQNEIRTQIANFHHHHRDAAKFLFQETPIPRRVVENISHDVGDDDELLLSDFINLMQRMCDADPEKRPSVDQIIIYLIKELWTKLEMTGSTTGEPHIDVIIKRDYTYHYGIVIGILILLWFGGFGIYALCFIFGAVVYHRFI